MNDIIDDQYASQENVKNDAIEDLLNLSNDFDIDLDLLSAEDFASLSKQELIELIIKTKNMNINNKKTLQEFTRNELIEIMLEKEGMSILDFLSDEEYFDLLMEELNIHSDEIDLGELEDVLDTADNFINTLNDE